MNTQMMMKLDALASTLMDRLSQLQDEIIGQVRDQLQQDLAAAMQQLQDANHALAETNTLPGAAVVPPNTTPIAAQHPFPPFETQFEINFHNESYRHDSPHVVSSSRRMVNKEKPLPNTSAYGSPVFTVQDENRTPEIVVEGNERIPTPSDIRTRGGVAHGSWREDDDGEDDLPGAAVLRATKAVADFLSTDVLE
jgi:hypothetical protein